VEDLRFADTIGSDKAALAFVEVELQIEDFLSEEALVDVLAQERED
jgi:hypothetical protein